tara:strand:+ start:42 stop:614 length:573 start_codon:yes stop_codon:yes gene_type:complete
MKEYYVALRNTKNTLSFNEAARIPTNGKYSNILFCGTLNTACKYLEKDMNLFKITLVEPIYEELYINGLEHHRELLKIDERLNEIIFKDKNDVFWSRRSVSNHDYDIFSNIANKLTNKHGIYFYGADDVNQAQRFKNFHEETILFESAVKNIVKQDSHLCEINSIVQRMIELIKLPNSSTKKRRINPVPL